MYFITTKPAYSKYPPHYSHSGLHKVREQVQGNAVLKTCLSLYCCLSASNTLRSFPSSPPWEMLMEEKAV